MKDSLGDRMKDYEGRSRIKLPRRTNTMIRIDGKAFHTYTRGCKKPFDDGLMEDMDSTAIMLCEEIQGCKLGYVQSDEITLWLTDYDDINTSAWFDGNIQKICSVSASIATAAFNKSRTKRCLNEAADLGCINTDIAMWDDFVMAMFDARAWTVPELHEVANTFLWRAQDAARNSVQMVARSLYSHHECEGRLNRELQDMIHAKGQNWNDLPSRYKCGRLIAKKQNSSIFTSSVNPDVSVTQHYRDRNWSVVDMTGYNYEFWWNLISNLAPAK